MKKKSVFISGLTKFMKSMKQNDESSNDSSNDVTINEPINEPEKPIDNQPIVEQTTEPKTPEPSIKETPDSTPHVPNNHFEMPHVEKTHTCCMCGAPDTDVDLIIRGGDDNYICSRCANMIRFQMNELYRYAEDMKIAAENKDGNVDEEEIIHVPTPHQIKEYLDEYVIGQDEAKIKLAVAVYNHYKRVYQGEDDEVDIEKSNALLLGATGSGKTILVKTIAKLLDVPMTIVDANSFTQAGYVGEDVESILTRLYQAADGDLEKAERGIVFIDEIDKIAKQNSGPSITKDVSGEGVQQALLKIIEGAKVRFAPTGGRKHPEKETIEIDTKNILFVCSGAFVGIEQRISSRLKTGTVGFKNDSSKKVNKDNIIEYLTAEDVRSYGMIPELVGRLPVITYVKQLDKDALKRILTEPKNSIIKQYQKLFQMDGVKLMFEDDALDFIVDKASEMKVGARGLRSIVEEVMTKYMFDIPSSDRKRVTVTRKYVEKVYCSKQLD